VEASCFSAYKSQDYSIKHPLVCKKAQARRKAIVLVHNKPVSTYLLYWWFCPLCLDIGSGSLRLKTVWSPGLLP